MTTLVMDASALIDTLGRARLAERLFARHDVCAPALLAWEVGNVVHVKHAALFGDLDKRKKVVSTLLAPVRLVDGPGNVDATADLVHAHRLTFYDAAYLQLAMDERAGLVTEDGKLLAAARKALGDDAAWDLDAAERALGARES